MPKSLVISNGNLSANFDEHLQMRDLFYPMIGEENHSAFERPHRVGVFADEKISWISNPEFQKNIQYDPDTLVGKGTLKNNKLKVDLLFEDFVYTTHDVLMRKVTIKNTADHARSIKLFFHHDFYFYGDKKQDTAQYEPDLNAVLHYRGQRFFLINGRWADSGKGMNQFSIGKSHFGPHEGTWRDAEDGELSGHAIEQGSVDSTVGFERYFEPGEAQTLYVWIAAGKNFEAVEQNNRRLFDLGLSKVESHTREYWRAWAQKEARKFPGLGPDIEAAYRQSLLILRTQIDNRGAIIAATDSDIMQFNKDTYAYCWPRDGAFISIALSRAGYEEIVRNFLFFAQKLITPRGFVFSKFTPDGSLGSSWHPKLKKGEIQLPIQEDESALLLVALHEFYKNTHSVEVIQHLFNDMVLKIGHFLLEYIDKKTGLPLPSYDLWEERRGVFSYTATTVWAGLDAAAHLSKNTGHLEDEKIFRTAAKKIKRSILKYLWSEDHGRFLKRTDFTAGKICCADSTIDASLSFIWELGLLPADDPRVMKTMTAIEKHLTVQTEVGGLARYQNDYYHWRGAGKTSPSVTGNPWIITTLWLANWKIEQAQTKKELVGLKPTFDWILAQQNAAGILPEQTDPFSGAPLSVAPLTWSHSTFVDSVLRFQKKWETLK